MNKWTELQKDEINEILLMFFKIRSIFLCLFPDILTEKAWHRISMMLQLFLFCVYTKLLTRYMQCSMFDLAHLNTRIRTEYWCCNFVVRSAFIKTLYVAQSKNILEAVMYHKVKLCQQLTFQIVQKSTKLLVNSNSFAINKCLNKSSTGTDGQSNV